MDTLSWIYSCAIGANRKTKVIFTSAFENHGNVRRLHRFNFMVKICLYVDCELHWLQFNIRVQEFSCIMIDYCSALQNTCLLLVSHSTLWSNTSKTWANILLHSFRGCVFLISAVFTHRTTLYTNIQIYLPLKTGDNCVFNSLCCVWIRLRAGWLTTWLNQGNYRDYDFRSCKQSSGCV